MRFFQKLLEEIPCIVYCGNEKHNLEEYFVKYSLLLVFRAVPGGDNQERLIFQIISGAGNKGMCYQPLHLSRAEQPK